MKRLTDNRQGRKNLFLIGFSGSGKSTVGPLLAKKLKCRFVDLDHEIELYSGLSIPNIFAEKGEAHFRRLEVKALENQLKPGKQRAVISLGGGAFQQSEVRGLAQQQGIVVYLSCSRAELLRRLRDKTDRPLLQVRTGRGQTLRKARLNRIRTMLEKRRRNYRRADLMVSTTARTPAQTVRRIEGWLKEEK